MPYPRDLTDDQWALLDAMLYIAQTGCQWRYLPASFGPWTRVWSQLRRRCDISHGNELAGDQSR